MAVLLQTFDPPGVGVICGWLPQTFDPLGVGVIRGRLLQKFDAPGSRRPGVPPANIEFFRRSLARGEFPLPRWRAIILRLDGAGRMPQSEGETNAKTRDFFWWLAATLCGSLCSQTVAHDFSK